MAMLVDWRVQLQVTSLKDIDFIVIHAGNPVVLRKGEGCFSIPFVSRLKCKSNGVCGCAVDIEWL